MMRHKPGSILHPLRADLDVRRIARVLASCSSVKLLLNGGEKQVKHHLRPAEPGPYVLIFAFDGAGYDQLMEAINSGKAPAMAGMLGKTRAVDCTSTLTPCPTPSAILPSTTIAAWSAIFTGAPHGAGTRCRATNGSCARR